VATFVADLDDKKRDLFILAVLEEMTIPEVAAALAIPLNTAYTRLRSVRADFEHALARRSS
jgi:RNA polymerase sigma-70 factor (ECF subfamily)